jgi:hypothetical protein
MRAHAIFSFGFLAILGFVGHFHEPPLKITLHRSCRRHWWLNQSCFLPLEFCSVNEFIQQRNIGKRHFPERYDSRQYAGQQPHQLEADGVIPHVWIAEAENFEAIVHIVFSLMFLMVRWREWSVVSPEHRMKIRHLSINHFFKNHAAGGVKYGVAGQELSRG